MSLRVSAIITTCDRPRDAARALDSILRQSRAPDEIIVVDDGVSQLFEPQASLPGGPDIRVIRTGGRRGACAARNLGARSSTGDVLMFLDDDDTWESAKVADQLPHFSDPQVALVYTGRLVVGQGDRDTVLYRVPATVSGKIFEVLLRGNVVGVTSSAAIRREPFERVAGFDEAQPARNDYDLWIRLARVGGVVADGAFNTRYTLSEKPSTSISSGPVETHRRAVLRIRSKYSADFARLPWLTRRRAFAEQDFYVAKHARLHGWWVSFPHVMRAFAAFPNPKYLLLLTPEWMRLLARRLLGMGGPP
jgi:glycosyltransferase involved in cell wall biosynthesis